MSVRAQSVDSYVVARGFYRGRPIICVRVSGHPPANFRMPAVQIPHGGQMSGAKVLSDVPALDWCYGCSATSAAMMMGYYDRTGYSSMYTGPTYGGLFPLDNSAWAYGECPLSATHLGYDGLATRGHVDDYWGDPDPYISGGWSPHVSGGCTADFMGTNQSAFGNGDGATTFWMYDDGSPLGDYTGCEPSGRDGCHGMKLFANSRGYTVVNNFFQEILGYKGHTAGFSFAQFEEEINADRPVMIQVSGHSMVGFGYDEASNTVYMHDTWDHYDHTMTWGTSYSGMQHYGVTVLRLIDLVLLSGPGGVPNPVASSGTTQCSASIQDFHLHPLSYQWTAVDSGGAAAGSFDNPAAAAPHWTAPANNTGSPVDYTVWLTVTCSLGNSVRGSYSQRVSPALKPRVVSATGLSTTHADVVFDRQLDKASAETVSNYAINNGLRATAAALDANGTAVHLTTSTQTVGTTYTVTVSNVKDTGGHVVDPAYNHASWVAIKRQPDLLICNNGDASYLGNGVYNTSGSGQTKTQSVARNVMATYLMQLQNDGNVTDTMKVTGTAGNTSFQVRYFDGAMTEITAAMTSTSGWTPTALAPAAACSLRVQVTPLTGASGNSSLSLSIKATSTTDTTKADLVKATTTCPPEYRADMQIKVSTDPAYLGDNIYNADGTSQTASKTVASGTKVTYYLMVQNDGNMTDTFRVVGTGGTADWTIRYWDSTSSSAADITTAVTTTGWTSASVSRGSSKTLRVEVTPGASVGGSMNVLVTGTSVTDSSKPDTVKATTAVAATYRPDLVLDGLGDSIYNTTGVGQSRTESVMPDVGEDEGETAEYWVQVQNDGNVRDTIKVTGTAGKSNWQLWYEDASSNDITVAMTSTGGWTTTLDPGATCLLVAYVRPLPGAAGLSSEALSIKATSNTDPTKADLVKATTTCYGDVWADMLIKVSTDSYWIGNDNYGDSDETASKTVAAGTKVTYYLMVQNDGNVTDTFRVVGTPGNADWTVRYWDSTSSSALDITTAVTTTGWTTASLSMTRSKTFRVEVTPGASAGGTMDVFVDANSVGTSERRDTVTASTSVGVSAASAAGTGSFGTDLGPGRWLIGLPACPLSATTEEILGGADVACWDAGAQSYRVSPASQVNLTPGAGCWISTATGLRVSFVGTPAAGPVVCQLRQGWNLLANPYPQSLTWDRVIVEASAASMAWTQNEAGTGYELVSSLQGLGAGAEIAPWHGFWLWADNDCSVTLGAPQGARVAAAASPVVWAMQVVARAGQAVDADNFLGVARAGASLTAAEPPPAGNGYVDLHVLSPNGEPQAVSLVGEGQATAWDLRVETDLAGTQVDILFPDLSMVPSSLSLTLRDVDAGREVNMRTASSYSFMAGDVGVPRHLRVVAAQRNNQLSLVTSATARATAMGAQIAFTLSGAAQVDIEVLNLAGRTVARMPAQSLSAGMHAMTWAGVGLTGARAPSGQYLFRIRCLGDKGTQTSRIVPARIR